LCSVPLGVHAESNNCSFFFRLQVQQFWRMVSRNGCRATQIIFTPNNCYPDPRPRHWAAGPAGRKANNSSFQGGCRRPRGKKANNYYQFWRLQVWALGWRSEQLFVFLTQAGMDPNKKTPSR